MEIKETKQSNMASETMPIITWRPYRIGKCHHFVVSFWEHNAYASATVVKSNIC